MTHSSPSLLQRSLSAAALASAPFRLPADTVDWKPFEAEIARRHDEAVGRLQDWIRQPAIAAENRGMNEGCDLLMRMLRDAGFDAVAKIPTGGHPGVFATLDAGAPKTVGVYFMYDVKQADPSEWSSPPFEARLVDRPGVGKILIGRGAVNQKGPEAMWLAALHAFKGTHRKLPVNLVFVAEGEEEIGSPTSIRLSSDGGSGRASQMHRRLHADADADAGRNGDHQPRRQGRSRTGIGVERRAVASRTLQDLHSSNEARVDSPVWHLVQALATLVGPDGHTPAIDGYAEKARPLNAEEKALIREAATRQSEDVAKKQMGVEHWVHDVDWLESLELLAGRPTVNIEGLVSGYTGRAARPFCPIARWRNSTCAWCRT